MTANQIKGRGFKGALRYNLDKVNRGVAELIDHSFASSHEQTIMREIQLIRSLRPNLQKFFYHTSINFPPSEQLPNATLTQIARDYLETCGFTQHPFITFRHHDADHPHIHILVSRIAFDGSVLTDSNDFRRSEHALRALELKYDLTQVTPSSKVAERAMTKNEWEAMKRTSKPSDKMNLQVIIGDILKQHPGSLQDFINTLQAHKINVFFNQATTGYVSGITYEHNGFRITGAKLGSRYKWTTLKSMLNYEQERDRPAIYQANKHAATNEPYGHSGRSHGNTPQGSTPQKSTTNEGPSANGSKHAGNRPHDGATTRNNKNNTPGNDWPDPITAAGQSLAPILDDLTHGHPGNPDDQPSHTRDKMRRRRRKKRRSI